LPRGVVIPWWIGGGLWRVNIRRPVGEPKYVGPAGSSNGLYNADGLMGKLPAMLVEGEIDGLTVKQCAGDLVTGVASGSTCGSRNLHWIAKLALAPLVLVAFDCDDAGEHASGYWLEKLSLARRWRPYWADVNAVAQAGVDVRAWVIEGLRHHGHGLIGNSLPSVGEHAEQRTKIKLEDLPGFLEANKLQAVGGDPDVGGRPWRPTLWLAPVSGLKA